MTVQTAARQGVFEGMPAPLYAASPSRLLSFLDCPRRYRLQYLDRPRPVPRPQRAHTSIGLATHNALRDWWDLPRRERTASARKRRRGGRPMPKASVSSSAVPDPRTFRPHPRVLPRTRMTRPAPKTKA